jgi:2-polyprenyl-3-methyl-5-hydroxy-6-metoxy-1,4-benzoquinol methylase
MSARLQSPVRSSYSPSHPYDVKGEWVRHDLLAAVQEAPRRVLSLGCGTGATEERLQAAGAQVFGVDVAADAVAIARRRLTCVLVGDVERDPLPELRQRSFDLVLCGDVLEHLRFPEHVLGRLRGWLVDGGTFVLSVPNATHYSVLRELAWRRNWRYEDAGLFDRGHYRLFTKTSLLRMLAQAGFAVEAVTSIRPLSRKARLLRWLLAPVVWLRPGVDEYFVQTWTVRARAVGAG